MRYHWPSKSQWGQFLKVLNKKEKIIFLFFLILFFASSFFLSFNFYFKNTKIVPAEGGSYTEGVIGAPRFINPIYAASSDVDRDLTELIYSGLMKYDKEGKIVPDLAQDYKMLDEGKIFEFTLKENLLWEDSQPLGVDDIVFTIKTIQNPLVKSPFRASWLGVKVEKISERVVRFELKNPSAVFLENCTLKILPQHIWQDISYQNLPLSIYNLKPIGSGPYKLKKITQDKTGTIKSLELVRNQNYSGKTSYISKIIFKFFNNETELISAFNSGEINGLSLSSPKSYQNLKNSNFSKYSLSLPRYFSIFFNEQRNKILSEENVRKALNYGTNKKEIIEKVLFGQGKIVDSPILPEIYGFEKTNKVYNFDLEKAKKLLEEAGFVVTDEGQRIKTIEKKPSFQFKSDLRLGSQGDEVKELQKCLAKDPEVYPEGEITGYFGNKTKMAVIKFQEKYASEILKSYGLTSGTGVVLKSTRKKLNELCAAPVKETLLLSFTLTTVDQPTLKEVASLIKEQWKLLGVNLEIKTFDISSLEEEIIKPRNYEMLLFGEVLTSIPDLFPFWHSSQVKDPGLNLAGYQNKKADILLEETRRTLDEKERKEALEKFQNILIEDAPVIFLYRPDYLYLVSKEIKGLNVKIITDSAKRFSGIENWYIETKRAWK